MGRAGSITFPIKSSTGATLVDFNAVLRRARENAAETGGYHGNRGNRESDPQDIKGLADGGAVATETTAVDTSGNQIENGSHSNHRAEVATAEWIPKNAIENNELARTVSTVATVATQKSIRPQFSEGDDLGMAIAPVATLPAYRSALVKFKDHRPHGFTRFRHDQACWAAEMFLIQWGELATEFGWPVDYIFGPHGLAWWLGVEIVTALGPEHAVTEVTRVYDRVTHTDWLNTYRMQGNG